LNPAEEIFFENFLAVHERSIVSKLQAEELARSEDELEELRLEVKLEAAKLEAAKLDDIA
jgi:hypothetical protein